MQIQWKEPSKALTKLHPRERDQEEEDIIDFGSFFTFFEVENDPAEVSIFFGVDIDTTRLQLGLFDLLDWDTYC
jgi:template-activating factor I